LKEEEKLFLLILLLFDNDGLKKSRVS